MSLYLKYRPESLDQIVGNAKEVEILDKMLTNKKTCPHSFLLHGPTGCGKTTVARIIAKRLGAENITQLEVDSADFRGIDTVREIREASRHTPIVGDARVWIIDECHKMTEPAQNAILKQLEDSPKHTYFILCTTEKDKLLKTIQGRCQPFRFSQLEEIEMIGLLRRICRLENESVSRDVLEMIARDSLGHPRNAINVLEQVLKVDEEKRIEVAEQAAIEQGEIIELCRALIKRTGWKEYSLILNKIKKQEAEDIRHAVLGYCNSILLQKEDERVDLVLEQFIEPFYDSGFAGVMLACRIICKS